MHGIPLRFYERPTLALGFVHKNEVTKGELSGIRGHIYNILFNTQFTIIIHVIA